MKLSATEDGLSCPVLPAVLLPSVTSDYAHEIRFGMLLMKCAAVQECV